MSPNGKKQRLNNRGAVFCFFSRSWELAPAVPSAASCSAWFNFMIMQRIDFCCGGVTVWAASVTRQFLEMGPEKKKICFTDSGRHYLYFWPPPPSESNLIVITSLNATNVTKKTKPWNHLSGGSEARLTMFTLQTVHLRQITSCVWWKNMAAGAKRAPAVTNL